MNCGFEDVLVLHEIFTKHSKAASPTPTQLSEILAEYTATRKPDAHAICDLAFNNYIEMRSSVVKRGYLLRKWVDGWLYYMFPSWVPLYTMVSFTRIRYSHAVEREARQKLWFERGFSVFKLTGLALGVLGVAGLLHKTNAFRK